MTSSLDSTKSTNSFLRPTMRTLEEEGYAIPSSYSAHGCAPPPPANQSHFNPLTNETMYFETDVEVYEIGVLFDYEIRHAKGVSWGGGTGDGGWGTTMGGWVDGTKDFFGDLFGNGDDEKEGEEGGGGDGEEKGDEGVGGGGDEVDAGEARLMELDEYMVARLWNDTLQDDHMTWNDDQECMGLLIVDEAAEPKVSGAGSNGTVFETKLLGISYEPLDYVNPDGCAMKDPTCTSIRGQVNVAYSGANEYGVVQTVISRLWEGMEAGTLIPPGSAALNLVFLGAGESVPVSNAGQSISVSSARGTEQPVVEEEESYLSKYGTMFVCFVAILGAGTVAAMYVRYRKRQRRKRDVVEAVNYSLTSYDADLDKQEEDVVQADPEEGCSSRGCELPPVDSPPGNSPPVDSPDGNATSTDLSSADSFATDRPAADPSGICSRVDVNVSPRNGGVSGDEIEVNLTREDAPNSKGLWGRIPTYPMCRN